MTSGVVYVSYLLEDGTTELVLYFKPPESSLENVRHYVDHFLAIARGHETTGERIEVCYGKMLEPDKEDQKIHRAALVFVPLAGQEIPLGTRVHLLAMEHFSSQTTRSIHGSQS